MPMWQQPVLHEAIRYLTVSGQGAQSTERLCDHRLVLAEELKIWDWCCTSDIDIDAITYNKCVAEKLPSFMWLLWVKIHSCMWVTSLRLC